MGWFIKSNAIGVDFGTTNSTIALADKSGDVQLASFPYMESFTDSYRSLLYLEQVKERGARTLKSWTGPEGIEHYLTSDLAAESKGRLIQSLKTFLTSRSLRSTDVFGRHQMIEDLVARILRDLREKAERQFGVRIRSAVAGRPVHFAGADKSEDDSYAEERLRLAFHSAGFESVQFEMEPVAAAYYYESTLDHDELILIGDFGGGTSDFSLIRVGPTFRGEGRNAGGIIGNAGVGIAGDAFDAKIIRHVVSPELGMGSQMRSLGKILSVPNWVYIRLERWHHLSLLRSKEVLDMLSGVRAQSLEPEKIAALLHFIKQDLGFYLHRAVQKVKCDLSNDQTAEFRFEDGYVDLKTTVRRDSFEEWIAEETGQIERCVDSLLVGSGADRKDVDMVFLTGGSSFVPAVRRIFGDRFGSVRIRGGDEFTSVARGLALKARELGRGASA